MTPLKAIAYIHVWLGLGTVVGMAPFVLEHRDPVVANPRPVAAAPSIPAGLKPGDAVAGKAAFDKVCVACHTVGQGKRVGPDLAGVHDRREAAWLRKWMKDPMGMGDGDPIGRELKAEFNNMPMPPTGFDAQQIEDVLAYVQSASPGASAPAVATK